MRIEQLTFTRFIAAVSIVIFHYAKKSELFFNEYTSFIFKHANVGVSYFFVLSGFVMIVAYHNKEQIPYGEYIKNRLARIYPVYILAILLMFLEKKFNDFTPSDYALNIFMIQSWFHEKALTVNFPGWSISAEMFFYMTFPFLMNKVYSKQKLSTIGIGIVLFWMLSVTIFFLLFNNIITLPYYNMKDIFYLPIMRVSEFLVGNLAGLIFITHLKNYQKNNLLAIAVVTVLLLLILKYPMGLDFKNGVLAFLFAALILLIATSNDKINRFFSKKAFVFLGEVSFGVYILQTPVWTIFYDERLIRFLGISENAVTTFFLIRLSILILLASVCYVYFEKPLRNKIKQLFA